MTDKKYGFPKSVLRNYFRMNRSIQLEGSFGVIKENYKFRQFLRRGKKSKNRIFIDI